MRLRNFILLLLLTGTAQILPGQLSEQKLQEAVTLNRTAHVPELDTLHLTSESMKMNGAICFYRNGNTARALALFQELKQMKGERWRGAAFWEAKLYAVMHKDSMAMSILSDLPQTFLNYKMLSQPEFDDLSKSNDAFSKLKQSLKPGFNAWTILLLIVSIIGLLIGIVLMSGKSKFTAGKTWLSLLVFSFSILIITYLTIWTRYVIYFPYLRNLWPFMTLLVGPSIYFYLKTIFKEEYSKKEVFYHFMIPAISFILLLPAVLSDIGVQMSAFNDLVMIGSSSIVLTSHIMYYAIRIHFLTQNEWQVDANIKTWTQILTWGVNIYTFSFLSYFILVSTSFFNPEWDYTISLVMSAGILIIAYMGLVQQRVFSSEPIEAILPILKYKSSNLTPGASESIKKRLERLLQEEQVFKENELRLDDLASYLDINRHQLSQIINEHYKVNFFELINKYRVDYVKKVLANPAYSQDTIIQIAYEAGFNNKASFNRYFKQEIGMTPSAFRMKEVASSAKM